MLTNQNTTTVRTWQVAPSQSPVGRRVWVNGKLGIVDSIVTSPYWTEMKAGIQRAWVLSLSQEDFWTSYEKLDELDFGTICSTCLKDIPEAHCCPSCGCCPACCEDGKENEPLEMEEQLDAEYEQWLDQADRRYEEMMDLRAIRESR